MYPKQRLCALDIIYIYQLIYSNTQQTKVGENMGKRKQTTIRIDAELLQKAQELGLNISKVCDNSLKKAVGKLEELEEGSR